MAEKTKSYGLKPFDSLFTTEQERQEQPQESVIKIPLEQMHKFKDHRYKVLDDALMYETMESIKRNGQLTPALVRPDPNGGYEIISGHRRHRAFSLLGMTEMSAIVREMDDDTAILAMVDSNINRDPLPSEKAWAYRQKSEALNRQGAREDLTSVPFVQKLEYTRDIIAKEHGEKSGIQVTRYIRLTYLIPKLLDMVDDNFKLKFGSAYELSFLTEQEQQMTLDAMEREECIPSSSQAKRLHEFSAKGKLTDEAITAIITVEKPLDTKIVLDGKKIQKFTPKGYTPKQMEEITLKLLENWYKKHQQKEQSER